MKCVVSSGTKKIRAGKDATEWIFMLPFAGEWTVQAGELSQTVSVAEGEIKTVSLSDGLRLLSNGVEINETLTGLLVGTTQEQNSNYTGKAPTITRGDGFITASLTKGSGNTSGGLMFNNTIDLTIYDTLHIKVTELTGAPTVWIGTSKTAAFNSTSTTAALSVSDDLAVDISSLTGLKAVGFRFAMTAAGTQSVTVADMWLQGDKEAFYLFKQGEGAITPFRTDIESGAKCTIGTESIKMTVSNLNSGYSLIETDTAIDLTNYSTLVMHVNGFNFDRSVTGLYIAKTQSADFDNVTTTAVKTLTDISGYGTFMLSVSSRSGAFYIGINGVWSGEIINWYLV